MCQGYQNGKIIISHAAKINIEDFLFDVIKTFHTEF